MATDYYRLRVIGVHGLEYNECVMHFKGVNLTAASYFENAKDLMGAWIANCLSNWLDMMPSSYEVMRLTASKASAGGGGEMVIQYQPGDQVGGQAGGAASNQLCPIIRLIPPMGIKTAGRIFLPAIAESQIAGNVPNSTWQTNRVTLFTSMKGPFNQSSILWSLAIYSRVNNVFSDAVANDSSPVVGFQRKRQRSPL